MIKEVETLLTNGIKPEQLKFYGLEYKYVTEFLEGELEFNDMYQKLNSAIHLFAKKQMTWFRRMEKQGVKIFWLEERLSLNKKIEMIVDDLNV
jgi:tRNA dimethylallyltransferase